MFGAVLNDLRAAIELHAGVSHIVRHVEQPSFAEWRLEHELKSHRQAFHEGAFFVLNNVDASDAVDATLEGEGYYNMSPWTTLSLRGHNIVEKSDVSGSTTFQGATVVDKFEVFRARPVKRIDEVLAFGVVRIQPWRQRWIIELDSPIALKIPNRKIFRLVGDGHAAVEKYGRIEQMLDSKRIVASCESNLSSANEIPVQRCQLEGTIESWPIVYFIRMAPEKEVVRSEATTRHVQQSSHGRVVNERPQRSNWPDQESRVPTSMFVQQEPVVHTAAMNRPGTPGTPPMTGTSVLPSERSSDCAPSPPNESLPLHEDADASKSAKLSGSEAGWADVMDQMMFLEKDEADKEPEKPPIKVTISNLLQKEKICDLIRALTTRFGWKTIQEAFAATRHRNQPPWDPMADNNTVSIPSFENSASPQAGPSSSSPKPTTLDPSAVLLQEHSKQTSRRDPIHGLPSILPIRMVPRGRVHREDTADMGTYSIATLSQMISDAIHRGEAPRVVALAHERKEGESIQAAFYAHGILAKVFNRGKFSEANYMAQMQDVNVLVLNPQVVLNVGSGFLSSITAMCEPVDITGSPALTDLKKMFQTQKDSWKIKWYMMENLAA